MRTISVIIISLVLMSACATAPDYGHAPTDYDPRHLQVSEKENADSGYSILVGAEGDRQYGILVTSKPRITIRLDKPRNAIAEFFTSGLHESVKVVAGTHDFIFHFKDIAGKTDISAKNVTVKPNRTYLVNYREHNRYVTIWIEDMESKEVIYGRKPES